MSTATQDRTFTAPVNDDETLPESVVIGGYRYDVKVADQAMLDDPKLGAFIDGLPGVYTPTPMQHGGSVWLHPDHGRDVLDSVIGEQTAYMNKCDASKIAAKKRHDLELEDEAVIPPGDMHSMVEGWLYHIHGIRNEFYETYWHDDDDTPTNELNDALATVVCAVSDLMNNAIARQAKLGSRSAAPAA